MHRESPSPTEVIISELLDAVLQFHDELLRKKRVKIKKERSLDGPVLTFASEIRQFFSALIGIAIDAVDTGGTGQEGRAGMRYAFHRGRQRRGDVCCDATVHL